MTQAATRAKILNEKYAEAMALLKANKASAALEIFGKIHEANPRIAEVEYQIGRLFTRHDSFERALQHAQAAVQLAPKQIAVWRGWAEAAALAGTTEARRAFVNAVKTAPLPESDRRHLADRFGAQAAQTKPQTGGASPRAIAEAIDYARSGRNEEAISAAIAILKAHPKSAQAANIAGVALSALGRKEEALKAFNNATSIDPDYAEAYANMALVLNQQGKFDEAVAAFRAAIANAPDLTNALFGLGQLMLSREVPALALHWLSRARALDPRRQDIMRALGNTYTVLRQHVPAVEIYRQLARETKNKDVSVLLMLAQAESHIGDEARAESLLSQASQLAPTNRAVLMAKASFFQRLARFHEAQAAFRAVIETNPQDGDTYRLYYTSEKAKANDPLITEMEKHFRDPALEDTKRMNFGFALAKVHEDLKNYDRVFDYLDPANALMRKLHPYDHSQYEKRIEELFKKMDGLDWQNFHAPNPTEAGPIFVTGMPRSGTTLVEQIIASHSRVTGGGEIGDGTVSANRLITPTPASRMRAATSVKPQEFSDLGHAYAAMIKSRFPEADLITDKSISTYLTMGLMKLAMPNAKFIVVRRDPRDNLLSIYKNIFPVGTHLYAYDQVDLARQYKMFVRAIDYWRERIPGWFYEVQYEALVDDPEPQSRALIAACGLEWEEACLNFHANKRKVETLSVFQVRQPISKNSVRAWERYGNRMDPMINRLRADGMIED